MRRTAGIWCVCVAAAALVATAPSDAVAQQAEEGTITVVQPKPVLRRHRLEISPRASMTVSDPLVRQLSGGGVLSFNISERFSVSGLFEWFDFGNDVAGPTDSYEDVIAFTSSIPSVAQLKWFGAAEFGYVPIYGKFVLFNRWIVFYDMFLTGGLGMVETHDSPHVAGTASLGARVYLSRWLALTTDVRDRMHVEEFDAGSTFRNTVSIGLGLSIFAPFNFEYSSDGGERR